MTTTLSPLSAALALEGDTAILDRRRWSWAGPHGGLLAALAPRRAGRPAGDGRSPRALTAQNLDLLEPGPVVVRARGVREGGSSSTLSAELLRPDGNVAVTAVLAKARSAPDAPAPDVPAPDVPAPDVPGSQDCAPVELRVSSASGVDDDVHGWVLIRIATRTAGDAWCVDDAEVRTSDGRLLVHSRRTRRVLGALVLGS